HQTWRSGNRAWIVRMASAAFGRPELLPRLLLRWSQVRILAGPFLSLLLQHALPANRRAGRLCPHSTIEDILLAVVSCRLRRAAPPAGEPSERDAARSPAVRRSPWRLGAQPDV